MITINGKVFSGKTINVVGQRIVIDGVEHLSNQQGIIRIEITGDLASLKSDAPVVVNGNIKGDVTADGPLSCGDVEGNVKAGGPVNCGNVKGNLRADGPVICN